MDNDRSAHQRGGIKHICGSCHAVACRCSKVACSTGGTELWAELSQRAGGRTIFDGAIGSEGEISLAGHK